MPSGQISVRDRIRLGSTDSVLVFAPHPDDETLGAGGLLQRAHAAGARVHVTVVTNGEDNPWPQRLYERCWRIGDAGRRRLARRRRLENDRAVALLGLRRATRSFLALPDRGVTPWLLADARSAVARFAAEIRRHRATVIVVPSLADRHPDHSAVGLLVDLALETKGELRGARRLCYSIHGARSSYGDDSWSLSLSAAELARKRAAIEAYESQLMLRGRFYDSFARGIESFEEPSTSRTSRLLGLPTRGRVLLAGIDFNGRPFATNVRASACESHLSENVELPLRRVFWKRPGGWVLFDPHGWREVPLAAVAESHVLRADLQMITN
jgi:LmbE family N-acetylglucosaminyl deacetylase